MVMSGMIRSNGEIKAMYIYICSLKLFCTFYGHHNIPIQLSPQTTILHDTESIYVMVSCFYSQVQEKRFSPVAPDQYL